MTRREKILIAAVIVLLFIAGGLFSLYRNSAGELANVTDLVAHKNDTISYWYTRAGVEHANKEAAEGSLAALKIVYKKDMEDAAKNAGIKQKQIESYTKIVANIKDKYEALLQDYNKGDTISKFVDTSDKFNKHEGFVIKNPHNDKKKVVISDNILVPLHITLYGERKWFWAPVHHKVDAYSDNKSVKITGLDQLVVKKKEHDRGGRILSFGAGAATVILIHLLTK